MSNRIAYLAPELPGPSSTFVYKEIFALEAMGLHIIPFSVHRGMAEAESPELKKLTERRQVLYAMEANYLLRENLRGFAAQPWNYLGAFARCLADMASLLHRPVLCAGILYRFGVGVVLGRKLRQQCVQHLHIHFAHVPTDIGMYACAYAKLPFSFTAHANDIFQRGYLLRQKAQRARFVATISQFNMSLFRQQGVPDSKLRLIRCGVDSHEFTPRQQAGTNKVLTFGFLGRLVEKKGIDLLLLACAALRDGKEKFRVEIAGDGPLRVTAERLIEALSLQDHVSLLGALAHEKVPNWLETIGYLILPCKKDSEGDMDGIPVVLMEAMLKGIPVITTNVSGLPELVQHDYTGLVAEPNAESIADQMARAISENETDRSLRITAASTRVREEFDLYKNSARLKEAIAAL